MLAGWLFADLLLVLFVTAMASLSAPVVTHKHHETIHKQHGKKPPTPRPKPTARVLERRPHTIYISVPPSEVVNLATRHQAIAELLSDLRRKLAADGLQGRVAGFMLVFAGGSADSNGIGQAILAANTTLNAIRRKEPGFSSAGGLGYWSGTGNFELKIFFFA